MSAELSPLAQSILAEVQQAGTAPIEPLRDRLCVSSAIRYQRAIRELVGQQLVRRCGPRSEPSLSIKPQPAVPPGHKRCQRRKHIVPTSAFTAGSDHDGLHRWCAACQREHWLASKHAKTAAKDGETSPTQEGS